MYNPTTKQKRLSMEKFTNSPYIERCETQDIKEIMKNQKIKLN